VPAFISLLRDLQSNDTIKEEKPEDIVKLAQEMFGGKIVERKGDMFK